MAKFDKNNRFKEKVTPELYAKAKVLLEVGISQREIAEKLEVSQTTIRNINATKDHAEYKELIKDSFGKTHKKETKDVDTKQILFQQQLIGMIREQNKMLSDIQKTMELLSNKLTAIVEQLV